MARGRIPEFESYHPSHAVVSSAPLAQSIVKNLLPPGADDLLFPSLAPRRRDEGKREFNGRPLLRKLIASGVRDLGLHAWRHTVASWLKKEGGHSVWEIGEVLNHSLSGSVTSGYIHTSSPALKLKLLREWADHVVDIAGVRIIDPPVAGNVIPLRG
jgi:integrase